MKSTIVIRDALRSYKKNDLIFASQLYRDKLYEFISEVAYYKMLERMCKSGELYKISKGIYCIPEVRKYGIVPPSERKIVDTFIENQNGVVVGYTMYNQLNLTTQISKDIQIFSSRLESKTKTIRNIHVKRVTLEYTQEIKNMIKMMEVLQNYYEIQDLNKTAFLTFLNENALKYRDEIFEYVIANISYKKSTIAFLKEILEYYQITNCLSEYLSSLSDYKYPKMKEIYETSRRERGF